MNSPKAQPHPLLSFAFRPFFLLSACYGIWLLLRWTLTLSGNWTWTQPVSMFAWHAYEFQFGYALAVVFGFVLTAAKTWTGQETLSGWKLLCLIALWCLARLAMNLQALPVFVATLCDALAIIICGAWLAKMLMASKNYRNMIFLPILAVFLALQLTQHTAIAELAFAQSQALGFATSWWFAFLISLIGSRVIPFFTSRALNIEIPAQKLWVTVLAQLSLITLFVQALFAQFEPHPVVIGIALCLHSWRLWSWHHRGIWRNPLLWSLWLSYAFLPLALLCLALQMSYSSALHLINLGLIASMIVALSSRVALGHTGRALRTTAAMKLSFGAVIGAAISRGLIAPLAGQYAAEVLALSAALWALALVCYVFTFTSVLCSPSVKK
ncbi:MAG: NnrS family protein [Pseudomonadales bacterium]